MNRTNQLTVSAIVFLAFLAFAPYVSAEETTLVPPVAEAQPVLLTFGVLNTVVQNGDPDLADMVYVPFFEGLTKNDQFKFINREEIDAALRTANFKDVKSKSSSNIAAMGKILKADKIIFSSITKNIDKYVFEVRVFDCATKQEASTDFLRAASDSELLGGIKSLTINLIEKQNAGKKGEKYGEDTLKKYYTRKKDREYVATYNFTFGFGGYGALNYLINGYEGYGANNIAGGGLLRVKMSEGKTPMALAFGIAVDMFPLNAPEGAYGVTEDILSVNAFAEYCFFPSATINPYLGGGFGIYNDKITMDTPITGVLEHTYAGIGVNLKGGIEFNLIPGFLSVYPEAKAHLIMSVGKGLYFASHITFGCGAVIYL